jgi:hypothetical protein
MEEMAPAQAKRAKPKDEEKPSEKSEGPTQSDQELI